MKKNEIYVIILGIFLISPILFSNTSSKSNISPLWNKLFQNPMVSTNTMVQLIWENNGTAVCTAYNDQSRPQICDDGAGGAIITWYDNRNGVDEFDTNYDIYAQRIDFSGDVKWNVNGVVICSAIEDQFSPAICSDGAGGAFITWRDNRGVDLDIYAQKINSNGDVEWIANGTPICTEINTQSRPQIISDGNGGTIIAWEDSRIGANTNIFAQKVNSSGDMEWSGNGTAICTAINFQGDLQIISDDAGGAIITWRDNRGPNLDIYAQRVNSSGGVEWTADGVEICTVSLDQEVPQIISDGEGGAIITWQDWRTNDDIYAQKINSSGGVEWLTNGVGICTQIDFQRFPEICSDGAGGAIITWLDVRDDNMGDIYAQRVNSSGGVEWTTNGVGICTLAGFQQMPQICSDGTGGAFIIWQDGRASGSDLDIYLQRINSTGGVEYTKNGTAICTANFRQQLPQICSDGFEGAIITWEDERNDTDYDIYAQHLLGFFPPTSNHPEDITSTISGLEVIYWKLYDNVGPGQYRVLVNDTQDNLYVWQDWTPWINNSFIIIPINRSASGTFDYTIEYYNSNNGFGIPDTVIVKIVAKAPISNHPDDMVVSNLGTDPIEWILTDDTGGGEYRVWANTTFDNYYIWRDWTSWVSGLPLDIPINFTASGKFNYTIEYKNSGNQFGIPDSVIVTIKEDQMPISNQPSDFTTSESGSEMIHWRLYDDFGEGKYRVWGNDTNGNYYVWVEWAPWINNTPIYVPINRSSIGIFNYTIEFTSNYGQISKDTVIVTITPSKVPEGTPESTILLMQGIIIGTIGGTSIMAVITILSLRKIRQLSKRIER